MRRLIPVCVLLSLAVSAQETRPVLTLDEAESLTANRLRPATEPLRTSRAALRSTLLPSVRAEVIGNASRNVDFFNDVPFTIRSLNSVIAFDYSLFDFGLMRARIASVEATERRLFGTDRLDDGMFLQLLESFGQLYVAQQQTAILQALYDRLSAEADRSTVLVSSGELTNLAAADAREIALAFGSQLLEVESRRLDAAAKVQILTGLEQEPVVILDRREPLAGAAAGAPLRDDQIEAARQSVEANRLRVRETLALNRLRASLSGFVGLGGAHSQFGGTTSSGVAGVYGLSVYLSYPLFGGRNALYLAEARAGLQQSLVWEEAALNAARRRASEYRLREQTAARRVALMRQSVEIARTREESLRRLVGAGLRSETELSRAEADRIRREVELLGAEVERWKASHLLARMTEPAEDRDR
jgi:outer membrane protein TolC